MKKNFIINLLFFTTTLFSQSSDDREFFVGGDSNYYESRFSKQKGSRSLLYTGLKTDHWQTMLEKRSEKTLASLQYSQNWFYFSAGHRYTPIGSFLLFKDENFFSAFTNPYNGILPQPLQENIWLGLLAGGWGGGLVSSHQKNGIYLHSSEKILSLVYFPNHHQLYFNLHRNRQKIALTKIPVQVSINGEGFLQKKNSSGYLNSFWDFTESSISLQTSSYKEKPQEDPYSRLPPSATPVFHYLKLARRHYDRIETLYSYRPSEQRWMYGGNFSIWEGSLGALCTGLRHYQWNSPGNHPSQPLSYHTNGYSLSYEYKQNKTEAMFRAEKRENGDRLAEITFSYYANRHWKLALSAIAQSPSQYFASLYRDWSDGYITFSHFVRDRAIFRAKLAGPNLVFLLSASQDFEGYQSYYANIQYRKKFFF